MNTHNLKQGPWVILIPFCVASLLWVFSGRHLGMLWLLGICLISVIGYRLPNWYRISRGGTWNAERDYAAWQFRWALIAITNLIGLLLLITAFTVIL